MKYKFCDATIEMPYSLSRITQVCVNEVQNNISTLRLSATATENERYEMFLRANINDTIVLEKESDQDENSKFIFYGILQDLQCVKQGDVFEVTFLFASSTQQLNIQKKSRTFQDLNMSYYDVIKEVLADYPQADFIDTITGGKRIPGLIVQYKETDWDFLQRMASHFAAFLQDAPQSPFPQFYFGVKNGHDSGKIENPYHQTVKNLDDFIESISNFGLSYTEQDIIEYVFESTVLFSIGDKLRFDEKDCVVTEIERSTKRARWIHQYHLIPINGNLARLIEHPNIKGVQLEGVIKEIKRNTARIHFDIDPVYKGSNNKFIPYAGGINNEIGYHMPRIGSQVHIYFPNRIENHAIIAASVRKGELGRTRHVPGENRMSDPREKHLRNEWGKELRLGPDDMEFTTGNDNIRINLTKDGIVTIYAPNEVTLIADQDFRIGQYDQIDENGIMTSPEPVNSIRMRAGNFVGFWRLTPDLNSSPHLFALTNIASFVAIDHVNLEGKKERAPEQDYSQEIAASKKAVADSATAIDAAIEGKKKQLEAEAREKVKNGVIYFLVGCLAVAATIATGGGALPLLIAIGAASIGVLETAEGVTQMYQQSKGDYASGGINPLKSVLGEELYNVVKYGLVLGATIAVMGPTAVLSMGAWSTGTMFLSDIMDGKLDYTPMDYIAAWADTASQGALTAGALGKLNSPCTGLLGSTKTAGQKVFDYTGRVLVGTALDSANEWAATGNPNVLPNLLQNSLTSGVSDNTKLSPGKKAVIEGTLAGTADYAYQTLTKGEVDLKQTASKAGTAFASTYAANAGDPIDVVHGDYINMMEDLSLKGIGFDLLAKRYYFSQNMLIGKIGKGWNHSLHSELVIDETNALWLTDEGKIRFFKKEQDEWVIYPHIAGYQLYENWQTGKVEIHTPEKIQYHYDRRGRIASMQDRNENIQKYIYLGNTHELDYVEGSSGQRIYFEYENNKLRFMKDDGGRIVEYQYDGDLLCCVIAPDQGKTQYEYDDNGYLSSIIDACGQRYVETHYDENGRAVYQRFFEDGEITLTYEDDKQRVILHDLLKDSIEIYNYDDRYLLRNHTYHDGTADEYDFNETEQMIRYRDRNGNETLYYYDEDGSQTKVVEPDGSWVERKYDANRNCVSILYANGSETQYEYDVKDNITELRYSIAEGRSGKASYTYDIQGRLITHVNPNGGVYQLLYANSLAANASEVIDPMGAVTRYSYDNYQRCKSKETAAGIESYSYSDLDNVTETVFPDGSRSKSQYNPLGLMKRFIPPNALAAKEREEISEPYGFDYHYSFNDILIKTVDPLGSVHRRMVSQLYDIVKEVNANTYQAELDDGEGIRYDYDENSRQIRTIDPLGEAECNKYDSVGNLVKLIGADTCNEALCDGDGIYYEYDTCNRLIFIRNEEGQVYKHLIYDTAGMLTKQIDAVAYAMADSDDNRPGTHFRYNLAGWLIEKWIPKRVVNGNIDYHFIGYSYDDMGNLVGLKQSLQYVSLREYPQQEKTLHYSYDQLNRLVSVSDSEGAQILYRYDRLGNRISEEKRINQSTWQKMQYEYDKRQRQIREHIIYNAEDHVEAMTDSITEYEYDANGNLITKMIDGERVDQYVYNYVDQLISHTQNENGESKTEKFAYDREGNLIQKIDFEDNLTQYVYDLNNRLIEKIYPNKSHEGILYTPSGQQKALILPEQFDTYSQTQASEHIEYNLLGRVIKRWNALGNLIEDNTYDLDGRLTEQSNALGEKTIYHYDLGGRLVEMRTPRAQVEGYLSWKYEYDSQDQLIRKTDSQGFVTRYELDAWGRVLCVVRPDKHSEHFEYDFAGNITKTVDGKGNVIRYVYNSINRLRETIDQTDLKEQYWYDSLGRMARYHNRNGIVIDYTYNADGMLISRISQFDKSGGNQYKYSPNGNLLQARNAKISYEYSYDTMGRQIRKSSGGRILFEQEFNRNGGLLMRRDASGNRMNYELDILDRIEKVTNNNKLVALYNYDVTNRVTSIGYGNGVNTDYRYDSDGAITQIEVRNKDSKNLLAERYEYDRNGNQTRRYRGNGFVEYQYDHLQQIQTVCYNENSIDPRIETFRYDPAGNRLERKLENKGTKEIWREQYRYDEQNRLIELKTNDEAREYRYDLQGNLLEEIGAKKHVYYEYDAFNYTQGYRTNDGIEQQNSYDALGLRIEKRLKTGTETRKDRYLFAGPEIIAELDHQGDISTQYIRGYGLLGQEHAGACAYYHHSAHGDVEKLTDAQARVCNEYRYDAFGVLKISDEKLHNPFGYAGEQYDRESQQIYLRARFYDPSIGRFTQEDVYRGDGLNLYAYVQNNPVHWVDPDGFARTPTYVNGVRIPYASSDARPKYGRGQVKAVYDNTHLNDVGVPLVNPDTHQPYIDPTKGARDWDMGHKQGREYAKLYNAYMDSIDSIPEGLSKKETRKRAKDSRDWFMEQYRDPDNYKVQNITENRRDNQASPYDDSLEGYGQGPVHGSESNGAKAQAVLNTKNDRARKREEKKNKKKKCQT